MEKTRSNLTCKICIAWYFVLMNFLQGNWVANIPAIKSQHNLSNGAFGAILVSAVCGALLSLPVVTTITSKYGSKLSLDVGSIAMLLLVPVIAVDQIALLVVGITALGFGMGSVDISATTQAAICEKQQNGQQIMGILNAAGAGGGVAGVLMGGILTEFGYSPLFIFTACTVICIPPTIVCSCGLYSRQEEDAIRNETCCTDDSMYSIAHNSYDDDTNVVESEHNSFSTVTASSATTTSVASDPEAQLGNNLNPKIYNIPHFLSYLCFIALISYMCDGAVTDWGTLYFTTTIETSTLNASIGYALYATVCAMGKIFSDYLILYYSFERCLSLASGVASLGFFVLILVPVLELFGQEVTTKGSLHVYLGMLGLVVIAAGISVIGPIVQSAAGKLTLMTPNEDIVVTDQSHTPNEDQFALLLPNDESHDDSTPAKSKSSDSALAILTTFAYGGYLLGPPLFGGLSALFGTLAGSFCVAGVLMMCVCAVIYFRIHT